MDCFVVNGATRLDGKVEIESAKNAVLPMLAGCVLTEEKVTIQNCPKIKDVLSLIKILNKLNVKTEFFGKDLVVDASNITTCKVDKELCKELRSSIYLMGGLISRLKKVEICSPGGCQIGGRPIDIHIDGLKKLGVNIEIDQDNLYIQNKF